MVYDLQHLGALHAVHCLRALIMIDQYQPFSCRAEEVTSGYHAVICAVIVYDREVSEALLRHDALYVFYIVLRSERDQVIRLEEISYRSGLVDQPCHGEGIVPRAHDAASALVRQLDYGRGGLRAAAYDDELRPQLYRAQLRLVAVAQQYDVISLYELLHHLGRCRGYRHLSLGDHSVR